MTASTTEKKHTYKPAFKADEALGANLQRVAVDMINLHIVGKQAHWNVVGKNFRDLHLQLDELVESAREFSDEISERMRAIYITPDGRASTIAKTTSIAEFPEGEVDTAETVDLIVTAIYAGRRHHPRGPRRRRRRRPHDGRPPARVPRAPRAARLDDRGREPGRQPDRPRSRSTSDLT